MDEDIQLSKTLGLLRAGAALPALRVADVSFNFAAIIDTGKKQGAGYVDTNPP